MGIHPKGPGQGELCDMETSGQAEAGTMLSKKPTVILTIGMAGSGKTTFIQVN